MTPRGHPLQPRTQSANLDRRSRLPDCAIAPIPFQTAPAALAELAAPTAHPLTGSGPRPGNPSVPTFVRPGAPAIQARGQKQDRPYRHMPAASRKRTALESDRDSSANSQDAPPQHGHGPFRALELTSQAVLSSRQIQLLLPMLHPKMMTLTALPAGILLECRDRSANFSPLQNPRSQVYQ